MHAMRMSERNDTETSTNEVFFIFFFPFTCRMEKFQEEKLQLLHYFT